MLKQQDAASMEKGAQAVPAAGHSPGLDFFAPLFVSKQKVE
jgi:hypothetical protein